MTLPDVESNLCIEARPPSALDLFSAGVLGDALPLQLWTATSDGTVDFVNERALGYLGRPVDQILGWNWSEIYHPEDREFVSQRWDHCIATGELYRVEGRLRAADGSFNWYLVQALPMRNEQGTIIKWFGTNTDISEQKAAQVERTQIAEAERRLRASEEATSRRWAFLADASANLSSSLDFETSLRNLAQLAVPAIADWCVIDMVQEDGFIRALAVAHSDPDKVALTQEYRRRFPVDPAQPRGLPNVLRTGKAELYESIGTELLKTVAKNEEHLRMMLSLGLSSAMVVPLSASGRTYGAITLISAESGRVYTEEDLQFAQSLGIRAGLNVENARLFSEAQRRQEELLNEGAERQKATVALQKSEADFRALFELAAVGMAQVEPESGRFVRVNRKFCELLGYSESRLLGLTFSDVTYPEDREWNRDAYHQALSTGEATYRCEKRFVRKDGSIIWAITDVRMAWDEDGQALRCFAGVADITQSRMAEEEREQTRRQLEAVVTNMSEGLVVFDPQGTLVFMNPAALRLHGFNTVQEARHHISTLPELFEVYDLQENSLPLEEWPAASVMRGEVFKDREFRVVRKQGPSFIGSFGGTVVRDANEEVILSLLSMRDITEQKDAEAALKQSEEQFRQIANSIPQLAWMARPDGALFWYNQRWYEYTGTTPEQMQGWGWQRVHDPEVLPEVKERWRHSIESGESFEMEVPLRSAKGEFRWFLTRIVPLHTSDGEIQFWFGTNTDITDRRRIAEEREQLLAREREARAEAESANKAKDHFLAVLSHELRTPLAPVVPLLHELITRQTLPYEITNDLRLIERNILLEARLIDDLLDLTRIVQGKLFLSKEVLELHELLERTRIICYTEEVIDREVSLELHCRATKHHVLADSVRLQQVFWNLINNACKFSNSGEIVCVRTFDADEGYVGIEVTDSGTGFGPELQPRLFQAFEQEDRQLTRKRQGLGLGLAITKSLVEAHNGQISGYSAGVNQGATFRVLLPTVPAEHKSNGRPETRSPVPAASVRSIPKRILLVEDHPDTGRVMERMLRARGYTVRLATTKTEAVEIGTRDTFELLVSDVSLPDGTGREVMEILRQHTPIYGVAISGFGTEADIQKSLQAGFAEHLVKPVDFARLLGAIEKHSSEEYTQGF